MYNKVLLSVIFTENTPSTNYEWKWVRNKNAINVHKNYINNFIIKEMYLQNPGKLPVNPPNTTALEYPKYLVQHTQKWQLKVH